MATKQASITTIATHLGLAVSTVSRALSDHANIREDTKERVRQMAIKLNYQPNHLAAGLRKGHSGILGVVVPHISGSFFPTVMHGIEKMASKAGFHVMLCQSNEDVKQERANIKMLLNAQVEGILISMSSTTYDFQHFEKVQSQGVPLVFFDRMPDMPSTSAVVLDDHQGAFGVVKHLVEQGCKRIAFFSGPQHLNINKNRFEGYVDALESSSLDFDPQLVFQLPDLSKAAGAEGMNLLLQLASPPDAVFSSYDLPAVGALEVLQERNIRVPQDIALSGFSNEPFTTLISPRLTSVEQRGELMGEAAVRLFLQMHKRTDNYSPQRIMLKPQIEVRSSSLRNIV
ncbi:LacI family DNA-binding transcriptional regulator [Hymenobacter sp.]|uniref:LacI family DNA-binding transcriptional regulator n=1 Tax=Hymenobacter sp. TaxID=1898978 RepID=UPI002ED7843E